MGIKRAGVAKATPTLSPTYSVPYPGAWLVPKTHPALPTPLFILRQTSEGGPPWANAGAPSTASIAAITSATVNTKSILRTMFHLLSSLFAERELRQVQQQSCTLTSPSLRVLLGAIFLGVIGPVCCAPSLGLSCCMTWILGDPIVVATAACTRTVAVAASESVGGAGRHKHHHKQRCSKHPCYASHYLSPPFFSFSGASATASTAQQLHTLVLID